MNLNHLAIGLGAILAAYLAGRYSAPAEVHERIVTVEKIVEHTVEQKKEDKVQTRRESYRKDGTLRAVTVKTEARRESSTVASKESLATHTVAKDVVNRRGTVVGPLAGLHTGTAGLLYGFHANTPLPLLGLPIHVGGSVIVAPLFGVAGLAFLGFEL